MGEFLATLDAKDWIAVYAAIVSTLAAIAAIVSSIVSACLFGWTVSQSKPRFRVRLVFAVEQVMGEVQVGVSIAVHNFSAHDVHLSGIDFFYPYRRITICERIEHLWKYRRWPRRANWVYSNVANQGIESGFPVTVPAHKAYRLFVSEEVLDRLRADSIRPVLVAVASDELWNKVYSKPFVYELPGKTSQGAAA